MARIFATGELGFGERITVLQLDRLRNHNFWRKTFAVPQKVISDRLVRTRCNFVQGGCQFSQRSLNTFSRQWWYWHKDVSRPACRELPGSSSQREIAIQPSRLAM